MKNESNIFRSPQATTFLPGKDLERKEEFIVHTTAKKSLAFLGIWIIPVLAVLMAHLLTAESSPLLRMLAIVAFLFAGMKVVVWVFEDEEKRPSGKNLIWFLFWPGMSPVLFRSRLPKKPMRDSMLLRDGALRLFLGLILLISAQGQIPVFLKIVLALAGWSLVLHFGLFTLLTAFYQSRGWRVRQPFFSPWNAASLADFWSHRWNRIFSEMLSQSIYRPFVSKLGKNGAVMAVFAVSGLLHEAAISLPVRSGFGGPFCYFLVQGILVLLEDRCGKGNSIPIRLRVFLFIVLPLPLLFPPVFIRDVLLSWQIAF